MRYIIQLQAEFIENREWLPETGEDGTVYIDKSDGAKYFHTGTEWQEYKGPLPSSNPTTPPPPPPPGA